MPTIVITGPESSGKTTLAQQLANHFETEWLPEHAREYLDELNREYVKEDLFEIAKGQVLSEQNFAKRNKKLQILDTSLEVLKIWSEVRFGERHPYIIENLRKRKHDLYLLCRPDLPWEYDPQRENPDDREILFERYLSELKSMNIDFVEINGTGEKRTENAIVAVENFLEKMKTEDTSHITNNITPNGPVLLFDGVCNFCDNTVNALVKLDKKAEIRYAPLQSEIGQSMLNKNGYNGKELSTVVLISEGKVYTKSDAALQIFKHLGGVWNSLRVFKIVPRSIRDWVYDWVADNRYRWFGKKDACMIPTPEVRERFLA